MRGWRPASPGLKIEAFCPGCSRIAFLGRAIEELLREAERFAKVNRLWRGAGVNAVDEQPRANESDSRQYGAVEGNTGNLIPRSVGAKLVDRHVASAVVELST